MRKAPTRLALVLITCVTAACGNPQAQYPPQGSTQHIPGGVQPPAYGYAYPQQQVQPAVLPVPMEQRPALMLPPPQPVMASVTDHAVFTASSAPAINAASYILVDAASGQTLVSRNADVARGVASTQKILTALVVLDAGNLDKKVTVQASDVRVEPTVLGLRAGQVYTRRNLLYAFLIKSANDVANVLARDNAGSVSAFAAKMNAKARSLGATNSSFRNPHGLTAGGQYSTARDMARIAMAAYRSSVIRDAVKRRYYTFIRGDGRRLTLENTNEILGRMAECNGMKTGYTNAAGRCLISTASRGGRAVILVQLGTKTKYIWNDGITLMNWGLQRARGAFAMN
jgi:D-alanyl-D-alanine carboxypeptidase (penicillin-binding protein 5/6)